MFNSQSPSFFLPPVFIYSMPGYSCSIKERMLYSSCKSRLLDEVEKDYRVEIVKKVTDGWERKTLDNRVKAVHVLCICFPSVCLHKASNSKCKQDF